MKHTQITITPVNGVPLKFDVKTVRWVTEPSEDPPAVRTSLVVTYKLRMRFCRKSRKALRHAARNTTPMSLRRIRK